MTNTKEAKVLSLVKLKTVEMNSCLSKISLHGGLPDGKEKDESPNTDR